MEKVQTLDIKKIVPDENQPRKYFAENKMATLRSSIKKHGIMTPLIVEETEGGKYLVIDGERRFRCSSELSLKEIPVIIVKAQSKTDRLIQQFHIQEQHEGWTAMEKSIAISNLADELSLSVYDICEILSIPKKTAENYIAFSKLSDKTNFQRNSVPISFAGPIAALKVVTKKIVQNKLDEVFSTADEKKLEEAVVRSFSNGSITQNRDITKLKDAFTKEPEMVGEFIKDKTSTPDSLFIKSKAKGAFYLRNLTTSASYLTANIDSYLANADVIPEKNTIHKVKLAIEAGKNFLNAVED
jgi:ParB family chromosome partitioning protein